MNKLPYIYLLLLLLLGAGCAGLLTPGTPENEVLRTGASTLDTLLGGGGGVAQGIAGTGIFSTLLYLVMRTGGLARKLSSAKKDLYGKITK